MLPAQVYPITSRFHQPCDDRRGRGLAVGAGDADRFTGAEMEKHFHLGSDLTACRPRRLKGRDIWADTG